MIGGTCGAEIAPVAYLNNHYESDLAILWFDAHGDLNTPKTSLSGHFHGMVLRTLLGEGQLFPAGHNRPRRRVDFSVEETGQMVKPAFPVDTFVKFCTQQDKTPVFWTNVSIRSRLLFFNGEA